MVAPAAWPDPAAHSPVPSDIGRALDVADYKMVDPALPAFALNLPVVE